MATVFEHLSVEELDERFVGCQDATASRHFQVVWLLARGHTVSQVSATTAFGERWIEQLLARYNAEGPEALGDLRRRNGATATILKPELLARLHDRLGEPPADGGLWSSRKAADWMAAELGLKSVAPQRGWEALKAIGWSIQTPRPKTPNRLRPKRRQRLKKARGRCCRRGGKAPRQADRGLCDRRAPHWPEAGHPPRVGAQGRAPHRAWPSPVRLALCHGVCLTGDRRNLLVSIERCVEGIFRGTACNLRARSRSRLEPHHPSRARQCGVAWARQSQNPRWDSPHSSAAL
jgi:transposase